MLEVRLTGKFEIQLNGAPITFPTRAAQSLFAYLVLTAGTTHRREKLAGMLWPDVEEDKARAYLRYELWRIRKVLSPKKKDEYLVADDLTISFRRTAEYWLDAQVLIQLDDGVSGVELTEGLSAYRGELLPGFYDEWVMSEREKLHLIFEKHMERLLTLLAGEKRWQEILYWSDYWISFSSTSETAYQYLMKAYDALGDRARVAASYDRCVKALRTLDLEPSESTRSYVTRRKNLHLPVPLTSFIGRENEMKEVSELLSKFRLVTLTGSGGVGKTRLAIQVALEVFEQFPDGVWFLDLAPLNDPSLVSRTLANLIGLRNAEDQPLHHLLVNFFQSRIALIIFDNCEHLVDACAQFAYSLLLSCESLVILATSREALRISGEMPYRVPSLEVPKIDPELARSNLLKNEALQLFVARASTVSSEFTLSDRNVFTVIQICQRLDGIPLAIELAVARLNVLTVDQILARLDDQFSLLSGGMRSALPRHQTLRATIEWSYDLLSENERILFRRLSVFVGGWTLEAAEDVCAANTIPSNEVLDLHCQLVNKSLVIIDNTQHPSRYGMLETIRQYACNKRDEAGEKDELRDAHLAYYLRLAETAEPYLMKPEQVEWLSLLKGDYENLRLAYQWSIAKRKAVPALNLCTALSFFWIIKGYWLEGLDWIKNALRIPHPLESQSDKLVRARALYSYVSLVFQLGNYGLTLSAADESLALATEVGDEKVIAIANFFIAYTLMLSGAEDDDQALALLEKSYIKFEELDEPSWQVRCFRQMSYLLVLRKRMTPDERRLRDLDLSRKAGERLLLSDSLFFYADWLASRDRFTEALACAEESDELLRQLGAENTSPNSLVVAEIAWAEGENQKACSLLLEVKERFLLLGDKFVPSICMEKLAFLTMEAGDLQLAQRYMEHALTLAQELGNKVLIARYITELSTLFFCQGRLGEFKQKFREGLFLTYNFDVYEKAYVLMTVLGILYLKEPEISARIMGVVDKYEKETAVPLRPSTIYKRYWQRAQTQTRITLGEDRFHQVFEEGHGISMEEALELVLNTVEEM